RSLALAWTAQLGGHVLDAFTVLPDGTSVACIWIYGPQRAEVVAFDADGRERWRRETERCFGLAPGLDGGLLLVAQSLHALDGDGSARWRADFPGGGRFAVADPAHSRVYAATNASLHAFAADGAKLWSTPLVDSLVQHGRLSQTLLAPTVAPNGDVLV